MHIVLVGANHRSCPIELRERLAFQAEQLPAALTSLRQELGLAESLILSTCNRVEIYAGVPELDGTADRIALFLGVRSGVRQDELAAQLYTYTEPQSVQHLFSVAGGLDSMVLGETEILHQVKHAYELARLHGATGKVLNVLFQRALNAGKTVREKTGLSLGAVSVGTVALELAQKIFGDLRAYIVVLVGAGKVGELVIKRLTERGVSRIRVLNRSVERAQLLASNYGGVAYPLETLQAQLLEADIVITSTDSPTALLSASELAPVMVARRHRPLCLIDLGVPRNLDPALGHLENVYLFDIDDLQGLVNHQTAQRRQAVAESQAILEQKVGHFIAWHRSCVPWSSGLAAVR